jgi:mRNA-decapping enzyme subunit 2
MSSFNVASSSSKPVWNQVDSQDEMDGTDDEESIFRNMSFEDVLEELIARFMVNLPREETTPVRLYWQAEQA